MTLATTEGREAAVRALKERRSKAKTEERIDNGALPPGAPMYFYCISCGLIAAVLPEDYLTPPNKLCSQCQAMKDLGWLE